jgi:hypothetical protein
MRSAEHVEFEVASRWKGLERKLIVFSDSFAGNRR